MKEKEYLEMMSTPRMNWYEHEHNTYVVSLGAIRESIKEMENLIDPLILQKNEILDKLRTMNKISDKDFKKYFKLKVKIEKLYPRLERLNWLEKDRLNDHIDFLESFQKDEPELYHRFQREINFTRESL